MQLLDLPPDLIAVIVGAVLDAAESALRGDPASGPDRVRGFGWVAPGDESNVAEHLLVDAAVWAAAGAPLVRTCRALAAAAYGAVRTLSVSAPGAARRQANRRLPRGVTPDAAAAAAAASICGFVRRCPRLAAVQLGWSDDADGTWTAAAREPPLLAALGSLGTVRSLVRNGGGLDAAFADSIGALQLTSLAVCPICVTDGAKEWGLSAIPAAWTDGLRRLLAAIAPTITRLALLGADLPAAAWVGRTPAMPRLIALTYPVLDLDADAIGALGRQCPALRRLDVSVGREPNPHEAADYCVGTGNPQMDGARLMAAVSLSAIEWLAMGPFGSLTPRDVAAALNCRWPPPPLRTLHLAPVDDRSVMNTAVTGFADVVRPLPAPLEWGPTLCADGASALGSLPPSIVDSMSALMLTVDDGAVWGALAGLPIETLTVYLEDGGLERFEEARFPRLKTLTVESLGAALADIDWGALAASAPRLSSLSVGVGLAQGLTPANAAAAVAALPRLVYFAYQPVYTGPALLGQGPTPALFLRHARQRRKNTVRHEPRRHGAMAGAVPPQAPPPPPPPPPPTPSSPAPTRGWLHARARAPPSRRCGPAPVPPARRRQTIPHGRGTGGGGGHRRPHAAAPSTAGRLRQGGRRPSLPAPGGVAQARRAPSLTGGQPARAPQDWRRQAAAAAAAAAAATLRVAAWATSG